MALPKSTRTPSGSWASTSRRTSRRGGATDAAPTTSFVQHAFSIRYFNHEPKRRRQLLLHKAEARKIAAEVDQAHGVSLVPLAFYFNEKNCMKVELAVCKSKNVRDKRQDIKKRDEKRMLARITKAGF